MAKGSKSYTIYIDNSEAERALAQLEKKAASLENEIKDIEKAGGNASKQMQKLGQTNSEIDRLRKVIAGGLIKSFRDLQNEARKIENQLKRATDPEIIKRLSKEWEVAKRRVLEYEANILKVERAQRQLERETQTFGGRLKEAFLGSFGGNLLANGVTAVVNAIKSGIAASINWALEAEGVNRAFQRLNSPDLLKNLRAATRGTVADLELMQRAVTANNFNIPLETLGSLLEFAQRRARETGQSVDYLVESIITGIARKSPLILDNLGINIKRINEEFKKTGDFAQAAFNVVNEELGKMGPALDTNADRLARLTTFFKNIGTQAGAGILALGNVFRQTFEFQFGDSADKANVLLEQWTEEQALILDKFRQSELSRFQKYQQKYNSTTADGRKEVLQIVKDGIAATERQEQAALDKGNQQLAQKLKIRLDIWKQFVNSIEGVAKDNTTLAGLQSQLDLLNTKLLSLTIGSKEFAATQAEIKQIQKQIDAATGKDDKKEETQLNKAKKLAEDLKAIALELGAFNESQYRKDIAAAEKKYAALLVRAKNNAAAEKEVERLKALEIAQINLKYAKEAQDNFEKNEGKRIAELNKMEREQRLHVLDTAAEASKKFAEFAADSIASFDRANLIEGELKIQQAGLTKELEAQKAYLKEAERQEQDSLKKRFDAKLITEKEFNAQREKIGQDFRDAERQAEIAHYQKILDKVSFWFNLVSGYLSTFYENQRISEDNELARDRKANEEKKKQYKRQLDAKTISQQEYDRKVAALDKQQDEKEKQIKIKQFKRDQQLNIGRAIIATAQAVLQAYAQGGPIVGAILAAAVAAIGAIQIGIIAGQEPPEYGRGGRTKGPRHKSRHNGMPVTNPETGEVQAYLEGDEGILKRSAMLDNKRYTVTGTPSQIASRLNSMHGGINWEGGAKLAPDWINYSPKALNFKGITDSIGKVRMFENGGVTTSGNVLGTNSTIPSAPAPLDPRMEALLLANISTMEALRSEIANGIWAQVSLTQFNDQQQRMDDIRGNSTFRPQP